MNFKIYMFKLSNEESNYVNRVGWGEARDNSPRIKAYLEKGPFPKTVDPETYKYFEHVVTVEADHLEHAFEITNIDKDSDRVTLAEGHTNYPSTSTGDIFYCEETGEYFLCATFGFNKIEADLAS